LSPVDIPRRMHSLSATRAVRGSNSEIDRPGTVVAIGPNSPRTSAGASGLGSHVECWGGPPIRNSTMHDRARPKDEAPGSAPAAVAPGRSRSVKLNPAPRQPKPPIRTTSRRFQPSQRRIPDPRRRSIGTFPPGIRSLKKPLLNKGTVATARVEIKDFHRRLRAEVSRSRQLELSVRDDAAAIHDHGRADWLRVA